MCIRDRYWEGLSFAKEVPKQKRWANKIADIDPLPQKKATRASITGVLFDGDAAPNLEAIKNSEAKSIVDFNWANWIQGIASKPRGRRRIPAPAGSNITIRKDYVELEEKALRPESVTTIGEDDKEKHIDLRELSKQDLINAPIGNERSELKKENHAAYINASTPTITSFHQGVKGNFSDLARTPVDETTPPATHRSRNSNAPSPQRLTLTSAGSRVDLKNTTNNSRIDDRESKRNVTTESESDFDDCSDESRDEVLEPNLMNNIHQDLIETAKRASAFRRASRAITLDPKRASILKTVTATINTINSANANTRPEVGLAFRKRRSFTTNLIPGLKQRASILVDPLKLSLIHISEPTRRTPISYAVFCLKKKM
eukprot:TRINITY_DN20393_c0_g1_i1.p1 TRINITY_DN20393_c0_g1~~TRINITY_DN20393_c0_g1_i1.p1  ORF type:complete len:407 (-),score=53.64 TRINITY_DN20393_c0_g1_i1:42-1160(-)